MARARIGSAVRFAAAEAIGPAPIKITASAPTAPWCSSADLNAATSVGSAGLRPEFMPGTESAPSSARLDWLRVLRVRGVTGSRAARPSVLQRNA
jgi:hypothetical protein